MNAETLIKQIKKCTICAEYLDLGPRPIVSFSEKSKILIIGQAPGIRVHQTGKPWDDPSGNNLRDWLGVSEAQFYNPDLFGIVPMGFCYPGKGKTGDLAPRPECAPQWHNQILEVIKKPKLTLLIGQYTQKYYLQKNIKKSLTDTVKNYRDYLPKYLPLPHPSPRNNIWMKKNPWFKEEVIPFLRELVTDYIEIYSGFNL